MAEPNVAQVKYEAIEAVLDRWTNDASFKERLRDNPRAALAECGIELTDAQLATMGTVDLSMSVEQLQRRLIKGIQLN